MEKIDSSETVESVSESPLEGFISTLKEKLTNTVSEPIIVNKEITKQESVEDIIKRDLESVIIEVAEEKENPFTSFVSRLKDIIEKGPSTETVTVSSTSVKSEEQQIPITSSTKAKKKDKASEPTKPNEYVNELEKIKNSIAIEKEDDKVVEIKKLIEEYAEKYIKKAIGHVGESGGGTNAVQYANGGTMNGNLNVNGNYLSGGVNLLDIFALQPDLDNQTLSFNESNAQLSISNGNTVSLSALNDKEFISSNFVHLSGDTMTGALSAPALSADTVTAGLYYGTPYGGSIDMRGSALGAGGSINTSGNDGGTGGSINTSGDQGGGGYINTSSNSDQFTGGYINTSNNGGEGGGYIDTGSNSGEAGGGYIDTHSGGYINTSSNGGYIDTQNEGGYIRTAGVHGGYIDTGSTSDFNVDSGYIKTTGGKWSNPGGYINTSGNYDYNDEYNNTPGGYIDTSGNNNGPGGSINTSGGGGLIDTRNKGQIQFGYDGIRTALSGSATQNRTVYLPDGTGTLLLSSPYIAFTNQDTIFEKNVTIQGNLTALGTSTFQNTVFTTTSALSVVSLGPGPALYVFQAAGPSDVASFYDGDGIEVLHVGNAQGGGNPLGQVGVNTSFPSAELTVNGAISSNGIITVLGGNSDQWNSAYTNLVTNSATYLSGSSDNKYFYKDINFTANANTKYSSGTRFGAITATLPSGVVVGDCIEFFDADGAWNTNSLIIDNNSYFIEGIYDRLSCNTRYGAFKLIYTGTDSVGWRIVPLPKHSVNSPTLASVTTNGQVITASSSQFNLIIDNTVDYFTFYINSTTQISLSNRYDVNNFANCSLSAFNATNVNIDTNPLFIQNTAILSSGSDNYYTLYYSNTGSSIVNVSYSQSVPRSLARDQVVIAYNQNSQESIDVANYYKNNRPLFSEVRTLGLNIPQAVYPARINTNGVYFCASGCDIDVPYEGCRKYDFISTSLVQTQIVDPIANYISTYPTTKYIVFTLDVPTLVIPDNIWGLSVLSATQVPSMGANVTRSVQLRTGIYPTYITGALSADCIAYIDKLSSASIDGITLYKPRNRIYTEDSNESNYRGLSYYSYPQTIASLSAYSVYRSGAASAISGTTGLTGIFMDQSSSWPYNTGNIAISSIAIWGSWGFNGRRYIAPNGPYRTNISGEGEVPGLSSMAYYTDPGCSGKLSFTGPGNGWYFNYTIESWNGAPHGGAYGYFGGSSFVGNRFWGSFPTTYTGVKTFSAFKASPQYSQGLRPVRHSCYTQYFAKNAFGSINYENTPIVYVGHSYEPFYPGALNSTFMRNWMEGSTAYAAITGNIANASPMVIIGDPLVKITLNSI